MYVKIDDVEYTELKNLSFAPSADLTGTSIPINEFQVDIYTDDTFSLGSWANLYDDADNLWASYIITYSQRINPDAVQIRAQSDIALLDRITLEPCYYNGAYAESVLDETIINASDSAPGLWAPWPYHIDDSLKNKTIAGFCPQQTARERLLWVCLVIGAYVKGSFNNEIEILPIDNSADLIPMGDTYWRPKVTTKETVTKINVKSYSFTRGTPQSTDTWVTDGTNYYIVTEQENSLANQSAALGTLDKEISIDGVYLVNSSNVSTVLATLAQWYFNSVQIEADVINNAAYAPGDRVMLYTDEEHIKSGYITGAVFAFGLQSKATLTLTGTGDIEAANLIITYQYDGMQLDKKTYLLPVGMTYTITNPYIDTTMNGHRYIYRPEDEAATGTIASGTNTDTEDYDIALDLYKGDLHIISVDEVTEVTQTVGEDEITIGVIS